MSTTVAGDDGRFLLEWPAGPRIPIYLHAEALGYFSMLDGPLPRSNGQSMEIIMHLLPQPLELDSLAVTVRPSSRTLEAVGFYERSKLGFGVHIDRARIEDRIEASSIADLLVALPGVSVGNRGEVELRGMGSFGPCLYSVFLDGLLVVAPNSWDPAWPRNLIHVSALEGIEVYRRPAEIPIQFAGPGGCGVVLLWTRR